MKKLFTLPLLILLLASSALFSQEITKEFKIDKQYLNIPIEQEQDRQTVHWLLGGDTLTYSVIRIADKEPDYWVFKDVSEYMGKKLKVIFSEDVSGLDKIYLSDRLSGHAVQAPYAPCWVDCSARCSNALKSGHRSFVGSFPR